MIEIEIDGDHIKLDSLLKLSGVVQSGGEAKFLIRRGDVVVDGEVCLERGRKVRSGMIAELGGEKIKVK